MIVTGITAASTSNIKNLSLYRLKNNRNAVSFKSSSMNLENKTDFFGQFPGFNNEKEYIFYYISPILKTEDRAGSSITICSADETVLKMFSSGIKNVCLKNGVNVTDLSAETNSDNFIRNIKNQLEKNADYYLKNGKRSVIILDNPEQLIGLDATDLEDYDEFRITKKEKNLIKSQNNINNVAVFKSVLDNCSALPDLEQRGCATTFIFKSKRPHLIHPHFRDGKMDKYYIDFPKSEDLKQILLNYLYKNCNKNLIKKQDIIHISDLLSLFFAKNENQGGYKIQTILNLIQASLDNESTTDSLSFAANLINAFRVTPRDFSVRYMEYCQKIKDSIYKTLDEYEMLKAYDEDGILDEQGQRRLAQIVMQEKLTMKSLLLKRNVLTLNLSERRVLKKLLNRYH